MNNVAIIASYFLFYLVLLVLKIHSLSQSIDVEVMIKSLNSSLVSINGNPRNFYEIELPDGVVGPEAVAFDCQGMGPYVGVSDGRILKWNGGLKWTEFATTSPFRQRRRSICDGSRIPNFEPICGRPLGLKFNPTSCDLYIADAYFGLVRVGRNGGLAQQVATSAEGIPFRFTNALDVDSQSGFVYFTDTSMIYQRRAWQRSVSSGDRTGRLLQYNPITRQVRVLLRGLGFPNGVALSKNKSFVLVAESSTWKIHKYWLGGLKAFTREDFVQLERSPDNIKRNNNGEFWVALASLRNINNQNPNNKDPVAMKFDEQGNVIQVIDGNGGWELDSVSEAEEHNGNLWFGSITKPYVGVLRGLN